MIKYGATASIVAYAAHLTTSLDSKSFNQPTLFTLRFGAKVVDVIGSAIYNYYFRTELQEVGKTIGYYIETYSPILIDQTLICAIQFEQEYLEPLANLIKDVSIDVLSYIFSSRFVRDITDFNAYLHDGPSINLYDLTTNSVYLVRNLNEWLHNGPSINLYGLAENPVYLARNLNEQLHSGPSINLYELTEASVYLAHNLNEQLHSGPSINLYGIFSSSLEFVWRILEIVNELGNLFIDLTMVIKPIIWLYNVFTELILTPFFDFVDDYYDIFLELYNTPVNLASLAIYLDRFAVKLMDLWNYPIDLTPETLIQWLDEPLDLTFEEVLEQVTLYKEAFIEWLNAPSNFNEILSSIASTYMFKFIFVATGKILLEDHIKSPFMKILLTGVIINELGETIQKTAKEINNNIVAQNNLKAISFTLDATDSVIMSEPNISTLGSCFLVTNLTKTEFVAPPSLSYESSQQKTFTRTLYFYTDNNSGVSEDMEAVVFGGICKNLLPSQHCDTFLCCL